MQGNEDIKFPLYRKYSNNKRFYQVLNNRELMEVQVVGSKYFVQSMVAKQYPEILFIHNLIECSCQDILPCNEEAFNEVLLKTHSH